jgi:hypothetical protein
MNTECDDTCKYWDGYNCTDIEEFIEEGTTSLCCRNHPCAVKEKKKEKSSQSSFPSN